MYTGFYACTHAHVLSFNGLLDRLFVHDQVEHIVLEDEAVQQECHHARDIARCGTAINSSARCTLRRRVELLPWRRGHPNTTSTVSCVSDDVNVTLHMTKMPLMFAPPKHRKIRSVPFFASWRSTACCTSSTCTHHNHHLI